MASYLLPRHGGRAMGLYLSEQIEPKILKDLVDRTINSQALPLQSFNRQQKSQGRKQVLNGVSNTLQSRLAPGPTKVSGGDYRRVVLPMFTWDEEHVSPLLADICPPIEDQIVPDIPAPILKILAGYGSGAICTQGLARHLITFNECDATDRLQPQSEAEYFPWGNEKNWQQTLASPLTASKHLDVVLEVVQRGKLASEKGIAENAYLPDSHSKVRPLAEMYNVINLPPDIGEQIFVPLLHPNLKGHPLFKRPSWKLQQFKLDDYLDKVQLEQATLEERRKFWRWLRDNRKGLTRNNALRRIAGLPVWPSIDHSLVVLGELCEPSNKRVAIAMGNAIQRPSSEILKSGLVKTAGRGLLAIRSLPTEDEVREFLSARLQRFPHERPLTGEERLEFQKFENDMAFLASVRQIREALIRLSDEHAVALASDGYLRKPSELVRNEGSTARLHLPKRHIIDRSQKKLDQLKGWAPQQNPTSNQIVNAFIEDSSRAGAHEQRLKVYLEQAKREGVEPVGLYRVPCIPVNGVLCSPSELALPGDQISGVGGRPLYHSREGSVRRYKGSTRALELLVECLLAWIRYTSSNGSLSRARRLWPPTWHRYYATSLTSKGRGHGVNSILTFRLYPWNTVPMDTNYLPK